MRHVLDHPLLLACVQHVVPELLRWKREQALLEAEREKTRFLRDRLGRLDELSTALVRPEPVPLDPYAGVEHDALTRVRIAQQMVEEASRFAHADGVKHPEVVKRLRDAREQLAGVPQAAELAERLLQVREPTDLVELSAELERLRDALRDGKPYSQYEPAMDVATDCVACARAHLLGAALRLRLAKGVELGSEAYKGLLERAAGELIQLEREDWSSARLARTTPEQRELILRFLPRVRRLRQAILNEIDSPERLAEVAEEAQQLWRDFAEATGTFKAGAGTRG